MCVRICFLDNRLASTSDTSCILTLYSCPFILCVRLTEVYLACKKRLYFLEHTGLNLDPRAENIQTAEAFRGLTDEFRTILNQFIVFSEGFGRLLVLYLSQAAGEGIKEGATESALRHAISALGLASDEDVVKDIIVKFEGFIEVKRRYSIIDEIKREYKQLLEIENLPLPPAPAEDANDVVVITMLANAVQTSTLSLSNAIEYKCAVSDRMDVTKTSKDVFNDLVERAKAALDEASRDKHQERVLKSRVVAGRTQQLMKLQRMLRSAVAELTSSRSYNIVGNTVVEAQSAVAAAKSLVESQTEGSFFTACKEAMRCIQTLTQIQQQPKKVQPPAPMKKKSKVPNASTSVFLTSPPSERKRRRATDTSPLKSAGRKKKKKRKMAKKQVTGSAGLESLAVHYRPKATDLTALTMSRPSTSPLSTTKGGMTSLTSLSSSWTAKSPSRVLKKASSKQSSHTPKKGRTRKKKSTPKRRKEQDEETSESDYEFEV